MMWCEDCKKHKYESRPTGIKFESEKDKIWIYICDICFIKRCHNTGVLPIFDKNNQITWRYYETPKYNQYCKHCFPSNMTWDKRDLLRLRERLMKYPENDANQIAYIFRYLPTHCDESSAWYIKQCLRKMEANTIHNSLYDDSIYLEQWFIDAEKEDSLDRLAAVLAHDNWDA